MMFMILFEETYHLVLYGGMNIHIPVKSLYMFVRDVPGKTCIHFWRGCGCSYLHSYFVEFQ